MRRSVSSKNFLIANGSFLLLALLLHQGTEVMYTGSCLPRLLPRPRVLTAVVWPSQCSCGATPSCPWPPPPSSPCSCSLSGSPSSTPAVITPSGCSQSGLAALPFPARMCGGVDAAPPSAPPRYVLILFLALHAYMLGTPCGFYGAGMHCRSPMMWASPSLSSLLAPPVCCSPAVLRLGQHECLCLLPAQL